MRVRGLVLIVSSFYRWRKWEIKSLPRCPSWAGITLVDHNHLSSLIWSCLIWNHFLFLNLVVLSFIDMPLHYRWIWNILCYFIIYQDVRIHQCLLFVSPVWILASDLYRKCEPGSNILGFFCKHWWILVIWMTGNVTHIKYSRTWQSGKNDWNKG